MRIHISELRVGDRLKEDVFNEYGLHVLSSNTVISERDLAKLLAHHVDMVDIFPREFDGEEAERLVKRLQMPERIIPEETKTAYAAAVNGVKTLFAQAENEEKIDSKLVDEFFHLMGEHFQREKNVVSLLQQLNTQDDYTYQHSVQVGMIAYYLAKWLGKSEKEAEVAGKAGYLHDIGKSRIDPAILKKPGKLTEEEFAQIKLHTRLGYEIIMTSLGDRQLANAALQHHERLNGKGYPDGFTGEQIDPLSKIVAVADVYSAMISDRVYQKKRDLFNVLQELDRMSYDELDPLVVQTFIKNMANLFVGKRAVLNSGDTATVVMVNHTDLFRPLVYVDRRFVNLAKERDLNIEKICSSDKK
jgi:putative nucleotidyltransferase with HDIG domain